MKKAVLIPDSFKGTMSSLEICDVMSDAVKKFYPDAQTVSIPVADGGEGSTDAFLSALGGSRITLCVQGPYGEPVQAFYGVLPDGTAVVEMAVAAGLPLVGENRHAEKTTTYGVGQLIAHAAVSGAARIILGLGGSATNDGGTGAAAALGVRFYNKQGVSFIPVGETLCQIEHIDTSGLLPQLKTIQLTAMCDIDNPLCGENGAAAVFAPQKGADAKTVTQLDAGLAHLAAVIKRDVGIGVLHLPGAGAAGGMGGGAVAFLGCTLKMGIDTVLDTVGFDAIISDADVIFTGEGKIDGQSLRGKVVVGIARRAKLQNIPVIAVVGDIDDGAEAAYAEGVSAIFSINRLAVPYTTARLRAKNDLRLTMENLLHFMKHINIGSTCGAGSLT